MSRRRAKGILDFLRSPSVLPTTLVVTLFLKLFAARDYRAGLYGDMNAFIGVCFWLILAICAALALHFAFDRLTDWMARPEEPHRGEKGLPPTFIMRRP
jgi:hypothetical protein